jgi:hypothetical protein
LTPENGPAASTTGGGAASLSDASAEARKLAAAILEVLAGAQTPSEAAQSLGLSLARYYQLETRAVAGLVVACEIRRGKGRGRGGGELAALRRECEQLRRECARQQALARATRRTVGLAPPPPAPSPAASAPKRRKRRPTARALKMAALLQPEDAEHTSSPVTNETESNAVRETPAGTA